MKAGSMATHPQPAAGRRGGPVLALCLALTMAGCTTATPPRLHSLAPVAAAPATGSGTKVVTASAVAWQLLPVTVPPGVDQPQWVVRAVDGSYVGLEQERWLAPLGEELRSALELLLTQSVGTPAAAATPAWRIRVDVLSFETVPGRESRLIASWSITEDGKATALRCQGEFIELVTSQGNLAVGAAHRAAVARLGESIAAGLKALAAGRSTGCAA